MYKYVLAGLVFGSCGMISAMAHTQAPVIESQSDAGIASPKDCTQQYYQGLLALYSEPQDTPALDACVASLSAGTQSSNNIIRLYAASHLEQINIRKNNLTTNPHLGRTDLKTLLQLNPAFKTFWKSHFPDTAADSDSE